MLRACMYACSLVQVCMLELWGYRLNICKRMYADVFVRLRASMCMHTCTWITDMHQALCRELATPKGYNAACPTHSTVLRG